MNSDLCEDVREATPEARDPGPEQPRQPQCPASEPRNLRHAPGLAPAVWRQRESVHEEGDGGPEVQAPALHLPPAHAGGLHGGLGRQGPGTHQA